MGRHGVVLGYMPAFIIGESTISTPQISSTPGHVFSALSSINKASVYGLNRSLRVLPRAASLFPITFAIAFNGPWPAKKLDLYIPLL